MRCLPLVAVALLATLGVACIDDPTFEPLESADETAPRAPSDPAASAPAPSPPTPATSPANGKGSSGKKDKDKDDDGD